MTAARGRRFGPEGSWTRWVAKNRYVLAMVAAYTVVMGELSTYRFETGQTFAWDLGIMQQALYSAAFHGQFFYYTPELFNKNPSGSYFGVHCSLLMFPLAGFYRLLPSAPALLYLQAFVVAVAALPLASLCREWNCPHPSLFAALYLLSPLTVLSNLYDFHLEAFVPLGVFGLLLALVRGRVAGAVVATAYLLSVYEYSGVFVAAAVVVYGLVRYRDVLATVRRSGLFALVRRRPVLLGLGLIAASAVAYVLSFAVIYAVNPTLRSLNGTLSPSALSLSLVTASATGPWALLLYFGLPFLLLAFLPLFDPRPLLLVAPFLVPALFSSASYYYYGYEYGFLIVPGYILAAALGFRRVRERSVPHLPRLARLPRRVLHPMLVSGSAASVVLIVVVASTTSYGSWFGSGALIGGETPWNAAEHRLVGLVPSGASVLVDDNAFPWVANNLGAYVIPLEIQPSPVSFYDTMNSTLHVDPQYIVLNTLQYGLFPYFQQLSPFVNANYAPAAEDYGVVLLEWHYAGPMTFYRGYQVSFGSSSFGPRTSPSDPVYWHGPWFETIPGSYSWTVEYTATASGNVTVRTVAFNDTVLLNSSVVRVTPAAPGTPAAFTVTFRSAYAYDGVELLADATPGIALSIVGATLTETGP